MTSSYNRLKRIQQTIWRKAANALLMLQQHVTISLSFMVIIIFGVFWIVFEESLESHLFDNARNYGYGVAQYANEDLGNMLLANNSDEQQRYLERLVQSPVIETASVFDKSGLLQSSVSGEPDTTQDKSQLITLLHDIIIDEQRVGILKLTLNRAEQEKPIQAFMNELSLMAVMLMILATVLAWYLAKLLIKPINRLFSLPLEAPDTEAVESLDVADELKDILQRSGRMNQSPAPISEIESSGIHKLLAVEASAVKKEVVILYLTTKDMKNKYEMFTDTHIVSMLREFDRRLLVSVHGQSGMLLYFDGITATASFGMDDTMPNPEFSALSCALLLIDLMKEIDIKVNVHILREQRIILKHRQRMPVAVPIDAKFHQLPNPPEHRLFIHDSLVPELQATAQLRLVKNSEHWYGLDKMSQEAYALFLRQKDWTQYLLGDDNHP